MKKVMYVSMMTLLLGSLQSCLFLIGHQSTLNRAEKTYTVENGAIPPDFGKDPNDILLMIKSGKKNYDKFYDDIMESYTGRYEYSFMARLSQDPHMDTSIYRYYVYFEWGSTDVQRDASGAEVTSVTHKQFYVFDRVTGIKYKTGEEFSHWVTATKVYLKHLDAVRIANQE